MQKESDKTMTAAALAKSIRTQLTAIVGFAQMLKLGIDDPAEMRKAVDSILSSSNDMINTLDGVNKIVPHEEDDVRHRLSTTQVIRLSVSDIATKVQRVLIADDSPVNLAVMRSMFHRFGIDDVITATNGQEALNLLKAGPAFDLVLTDMWMPQMDGVALVRQVRADPAFAGLRVYAVTADADARNNFAKMGFTGLLLKPLTLQKIKNLL